jgi:sugar phosphate isomerase/epimerase
MTATISLQLYTVKEALKADPDATLGRIADIGFTAVELYGLQEFADAYAAGLAKHGLTAPSAHVPLAIGDLEASFDLAEKLGVKTAIESFTPPTHWESPDEIARLADKLNSAVEPAAARGLRVGYHNHDGEIRNHVEGVTGLDHFASLLDARVVLEVDAYWVAAGGEDLVEFLTRNAERIKFIHVKDGSLTGDLPNQVPAGHISGDKPEHLASQLPAGQGVVPLAAGLDAVPDLEFAVVEFDAYSGDLFAGIAEARQFLIERGLR